MVLWLVTVNSLSQRRLFSSAIHAIPIRMRQTTGSCRRQSWVGLDSRKRSTSMVALKWREIKVIVGKWAEEASVTYMETQNPQDSRNKCWQGKEIRVINPNKTKTKSFLQFRMNRWHFGRKWKTFFITCWWENWKISLTNCNDKANRGKWQLMKITWSAFLFPLSC